MDLWEVTVYIVPLKSSLTNNLILFDNELQSYLFQFGFSLRSKIIFNLLLLAELSVRRDGAMALREMSICLCNMM